MATRWAVSVLAAKPGLTRHSAFVVEAESKYEAEGKAIAIARKGYPVMEGWTGHHANVSSIDNVIDPIMSVTMTPDI